MAFGEPRIDSIDDVSGYVSAIHGHVRILAARLRMHLTDADVDELVGIDDDADAIKAIVAVLRAQLSDDYLARIGKR